MHEFLGVVLKLTIIFFLVSAMLHIGTSLTLRQILEPLGNACLLLKSLGVSYILIPLTAIVITRIIPLEQPLRIGLVLLSMTAGAEAGPKIIGIAKGNIAFSVALLSMQLVVTIIYVPLVISMLLPEVTFDHSALLVKLFLLVLLPMVSGLSLKTHRGAIAERVSHFLRGISTVFMILMVSLIIILNYAEILRLIGTGAILAGALFVIISFTAGYLIGGPGQDTRRTLGFMSGARNASIAFMIASQVFDNTDVLLMITLTVILMLVILLPTAYWLGRQAVA
jgi:bile acid:Na+ symporter, BASS family